jgi:hypothetical protein
LYKATHEISGGTSCCFCLDEEANEEEAASRLWIEAGARFNTEKYGKIPQSRFPQEAKLFFSPPSLIIFILAKVIREL